MSLSAAPRLRSAAADFNVRDYGGKIQDAVEAASAAGGGRVIVPEGVWQSGTIWLKSHVELHLEKGAVIKGSTDAKDYNKNDVFPENFGNNDEKWSGGHLVLAYKATNVAITGEGVIDGNGDAFFGPPDEDNRFPWYKYGLKLQPKDRIWFRPGPMVAFFLSKDIRLEGVTLKNTPCWTAHFRCCNGLDIRGVTIDADRTIANSDGFSIDCTRNVKVKDCRIFTGDDGFAIRASCKLHPGENFCENILVENCDVSSCCYGVRFGVGSGLVRNVEIRNCRILESAVAFGFTTAWRDAGKNCYIENVTIRDTFVGNTSRAFEAVNFVGDCRVKDVKCVNCRFEAVLPNIVRGNDRAHPENIRFENCTLRFLDRIMGREQRGWMERSLKNRKRVFLERQGVSENVAEKDCRLVDGCESGALLLSFDDRNFKGWLAAAPLFKQYGARATFFVSGPMDQTAVQAMRELSDAGHSVGLHGLHHADAVPAIAARGAEQYFADDIAPQLEACKAAGLRITSFAYPNCVRSDESDALFTRKGFERVRASAGLTPYDPEGKKQGGRGPLVKSDRPFVPLAELPCRRRIDSVLVGEAYHTDIDDILACIRRAAERKEVFVVTSHDIAPDAKHIHMKTEWLEKMLATAKACGLPVLGFDELPAYE